MTVDRSLASCPLLLRQIGVLATLAVALNASPAIAYSLAREHGGETVSFAKGQSSLSDVSRVQLARLIPRLNAVRLDVIIVVASGDQYLTERNKITQFALAGERAASIKRFFTDAGFDEKLMYIEAKVAPSSGNGPYSLSPPPLGSAEVAYTGVCKPGYVEICRETRSR